MLEDCDPLATIFLISMWLSGSVLSFIPMSFNLIPKSGLVNGISPAWPYSSTSWPIVISPNWDLAICELFWLMKTNPFYYTYNFLFLCSVVGPTFRLNLKAIRLDVYFIDFLRGHRTHNQPWFAIFFLCLRPNLPPSIAIKVRFFRVPPSQMVANFWGSAFLFGEFLASKDLKAQHTFRIFRGQIFWFHETSLTPFHGYHGQGGSWTPLLTIIFTRKSSACRWGVRAEGDWRTTKDNHVF